MARTAGHRELLRGPAGRLDCLFEMPEDGARGIALVAHPHPLYGGTRDNKVVQALAHAFVELGYAALRPNFRGVGESEGAYDEGRGEVADLAAVLDYGLRELGALPLALAGFSFGAVMQARLAARGYDARLVLVGLAVNHFETPVVPADTQLVHGERDETVPLTTVFEWARPQNLPVIVVPGADHFFHHRMGVLRALVQNNWRAL